MTKKQASTTEETALAVIPEDAPLALREPEQAATMIQSVVGMGVGAINLERIKVPTGGLTKWVVPTLEGEDVVDAISGIPLVIKGGERVWYAESFDESGGGAPPDCMSHDGRIGFGTRDLGAEPGTAPTEQECATCPWNQWASDRKGGGGKDCREIMHMLLLPQTGMIPMLVVIPPTSLKAMQAFALKCASANVLPYQVEAEFRLEKAQSKGGGVSYARLVPSVKRRLTAAESERAATLHAAAADLLATSAAR